MLLFQLKLVTTEVLERRVQLAGWRARNWGFWGDSAANGPFGVS